MFAAPAAPARRPHSLFRALLVTGFVAVLQGPAAATVVYVNNGTLAGRSCPNGGDGTTPSTAYCTIKKAMDSANGGGAGNVVEVASTGIPYREAVKILVATDSGSVSQPFTLRTSGGAVVIDGSEANSGWVNEQGTIWSTVPVGTGSSITQVYMQNKRYPVLTDGTIWTDLPEGRAVYEPSPVNKIYVNFGSGSFTNVEGYLSLRHPLTIEGSNVIVQGFTIRYSRSEGIKLGNTSTPVRNVTVTGCDAQFNRGRGVDVATPASHHCTISNNVFSNNGNTGIYIPDNATEFTVQGNTCGLNADPLVIDNESNPGRSSVNGIRIGSRSSSPAGGNFPFNHYHLVENNSAYKNQDTGIEIRANYVTSRYNRSWNNQDHGFDHLYSRNSTHVGDLSWGNNRDGMSFESGTSYSSVYNCVIANNGRDRCRNDWELEVYTGAQTGWASGNNVIWRDPVNETADDVILNFKGGPQGSAPTWCNNGQCTDATKCFKNLTDFHTYFSGYETNSTTSEPTFVDSTSMSTTPNFRPTSASSVIDRANSNSSVGYVSTDALGQSRFDYPVTNNGTGPVTYADIGPYEYYCSGDGPSLSAYFARYNFTVTWQSGAQDVHYDLYLNGTLTISEDVTGNSWHCADLGSSQGVYPCSGYTVVIYSRDSAGNCRSSTVSGSTACSGYTFADCGGGGFRAKPVADDAELTLALAIPDPSPARGSTRIGYSIPADLRGKALDLSVLDVAGRRVSTVFKGVAESGRFSPEFRFVSDAGDRMHPGVYFVRLRIGDQTLRRTIVLTP